MKMDCYGLGLATANVTVVGMMVVQTSSQAARLEYHKRQVAPWQHVQLNWSRELCSGLLHEPRELLQMLSDGAFWLGLCQS